MKSYITNPPAVLLISILLVLSLFSCTKAPYEIGKSLLPPSDTLNVRSTDTCTVEAFSVKVDTIRTSITSSLRLGSMLDPVFGKTTVSFTSQLLLSDLSPVFGVQPVMDSLILMLYYTGHYGDTTTMQNVKVWEVSEDLNVDSAYYSNKLVKTYPTLLADQNFYPHPKDSVKVGSTKLAAHLRINLGKLTHYLGNKILYAPSSAMLSNAAFVDFLKGLYVQATPVNSGGSILNFSLTEGTSQLVVYFHDGAVPANDSLSYSMLMSTSAARFLHLDHNNYLDANQDVKRQILLHDSAQGANSLFLQGLAGVKVKLRFPYMKTFAKGHTVAINDALLTFQNAESDTTYGPPPALTIVRQDSIGRIAYLLDANEGSYYFGGSYDQVKRTYFFRITRYMQKVMAAAYTGHYDLFILVNDPTSSTLAPNRIILNGTSPQMPGSMSDRFRLKVTYTILK